MEIQVITVTLNSEPPYQRVWMRAEDTARELLVNVIDNDSQPLDMTEYTVEFRARKPDNTEITYTEQVEVRDTAVYIGPIPLAKTLETSGIVLCELLLYSTTGYVGTVIWEIDAWMPAVRNEGQQSTSDYQSAVEAAIRAEGAASRAEDAADRAEDFSTHPAEIRNDYWWTWDANAGVMVNSGVFARGIPGLIQEVVAGDNITVDNTDPARPKVSATAGGSGSGDMLGSDYDADGSVKAAGGISSYVAEKADMLKSDYDLDGTVKDAGGILGVAFDTYTHSKSGTVHSLSGGTGTNIKFVSTARYTLGDTFEVNGVPCGALSQNGYQLADRCFVSGTVLDCFYDGATLWFRSTFGVIYTTDSQPTTERWVDGRQIYKKTFMFNGVNLAQRSVALGFTFVSCWVDYSSSFIEGITGTYISRSPTGPSGAYATSGAAGVSAYAECYIYINNLVFEANVDRSTYAGYVTVKYTRP